MVISQESVFPVEGQTLKGILQNFRRLSVFYAPELTF